MLKAGGGLPLHKLESVQLAFLTNEDPGYVPSKISDIGLIAPAFITISLTLWLSPAIFPSPQIAYSTTSTCGELNNSTSIWIVPFSINT